MITARRRVAGVKYCETKSCTSRPRSHLIERGALVTLVSGSGSVTVKSEGVALEPATLGQRVRVRSASGRVVEGAVEGLGQVRVGF